MFVSLSATKITAIVFENKQRFREVQWSSQAERRLFEDDNSSDRSDLIFSLAGWLKAFQRRRVTRPNKLQYTRLFDLWDYGRYAVHGVGLDP